MIFALWLLITPLLDRLGALQWNDCMRKTVELIQRFESPSYISTDALWLYFHLFSFRLSLTLRQSFEALWLDILLLFLSLLRLRLQLCFNEVGELAR